MPVIAGHLRIAHWQMNDYEVTMAHFCFSLPEARTPVLYVDARHCPSFP